MTTTAGALLNIMKLRLAMQTDGTTCPHPSVAKATVQLVERLSELPAYEQIAIEYTLEPFHARYVNLSTREVLAEIRENLET